MRRSSYLRTSGARARPEPNAVCSWQKKGERKAVAYFALGSFVTIFIVGIIWATRPVSKPDEHHHGTAEQSESLMHPGQK
jgi:hypothetical protein